jgi:hypothetical protein
MTPIKNPDIKAAYDAAVRLWYSSGVSRHAEGHPGLAGPDGIDGPTSDKPWDADAAYLQASIYTLGEIQRRLREKAKS